MLSEKRLLELIAQARAEQLSQVPPVDAQKVVDLAEARVAQANAPNNGQADPSWPRFTEETPVLGEVWLPLAMAALAGSDEKQVLSSEPDTFLSGCLYQANGEDYLEIRSGDPTLKALQYTVVKPDQSVAASGRLDLKTDEGSDKWSSATLPLCPSFYDSDECSRIVLREFIDGTGQRD